MTFKKPVPDDRTIVDGIWSDILDDWSDTFSNDSSGTSQKVDITNTSDFLLLFTQALDDLECTNIKILKQLELLNIRFEEAFDTKTSERDL